MEREEPKKVLLVPEQVFTELLCYSVFLTSQHPKTLRKSFHQDQCLFFTSFPGLFILSCNKETDMNTSP